MRVPHAFSLLVLAHVFGTTFGTRVRTEDLLLRDAHLTPPATLPSEDHTALIGSSDLESGRSLDIGQGVLASRATSASSSHGRLPVERLPVPPMVERNVATDQDQPQGSELPSNFANAATMNGSLGGRDSPVVNRSAMNVTNGARPKSAMIALNAVMSRTKAQLASALLEFSTTSFALYLGVPLMILICCVIVSCCCTPTTTIEGRHKLFQRQRRGVSNHQSGSHSTSQHHHRFRDDDGDHSGSQSSCFSSSRPRTGLSAITAVGREARGVDGSDAYRFGDLSRGLYAKASGKLADSGLTH